MPMHHIPLRVPTWPAELVHFVVHDILDPRAVGRSGVLFEGLECFAGAVGFGFELAIFAVGR